MKKYQPFSLKGCGYVQDLALDDQGLGLRIDVIQTPPNVCSDTVTLDCVVPPELQEKIRQWNSKCPYTSGVWIDFDVVFSRFGASWSDCDHPSGEIILLKGELLAIRSWQQDTTGSHPL